MPTTTRKPSQPAPHSPKTDAKVATKMPATSGESKAVGELAFAPIAYIDNPLFRKRDAEQLIFAQPASEQKSPKRGGNRRPPNVPAYFATLYEIPLLTAEQETALFRRFNYLKYRADRLRKQAKASQPVQGLREQIESFLAHAHAAWEQLIEANLRLVVSIARRFVDANHTFDELVSDGQIALMNAIEKFDFSRGFRFSTYATHAIQRTFYRRIKNRQRDMSRIKTAAAEVMEEVPDPFDGDDPSAEEFRKIQHLLSWIDHDLEDRERYIVAARFGLNPDQDSRTLRAIGNELGISKERVRQIQIKAIEKLQQLAGTSETPGEAFSKPEA